MVAPTAGHPTWNLSQASFGHLPPAQVNTKPSQARNFFDQVLASQNPSSFLRSLIASTPPTYETEWLDFKGAAKLLDSDLRKIWSQALAGFANTQGGVLVFGIDARTDAETKVDAACGESLVIDPPAFVSRLQQLHGQATEPPVLGVEIHPIVGNSESSGFVLCYIPESRYRPHRAEHAGHNYFLRALDKFVVPSVSILRALFYPHSQAVITPIAKGEVRVEQNLEIHEITIRLQNRGTSSAYDVYTIVDYQPSSALTRSFPGWDAGPVLVPFYATLLRPIHPEQTVNCVNLIYTAGKSDHYNFTIRTFAKHTDAAVWHLELSLKDLERKVERVAELQESK